MRRRKYLSFVALGGFGGIAGCAGYLGDEYGGDADGESPGVGGDATPSAPGNVDLPVPREELRRGAPKDAIPALVDPVFDEDWSGLSMTITHRGVETDIEPRLRDDDLVIGVTRAGEARAYPLRVLNWHEVVNDDLGGPLLVSYCPLCRSGVTAVRRAGGDVTNFGVSGFLFRNDLVMYDEATESLWSQVIATAINGELTGERLELLPSTITTWPEWRADHPETVVLRPPPESGTISAGSGIRNYNQNPYMGYQNNEQIGLGGSFDDDRLHPKAEVIGIEHDGTARAYSTDTVEREDVINDTVGGLPVVVSVAPDGTPVAYVRRVGGETGRFEADGDRFLTGAGTRWRRSTGEAVDGTREGQRLEQANDVSPLFWFAWLDFHPEAELYGDLDG
jgi:hypothetical protein